MSKKQHFPNNNKLTGSCVEVQGDNLAGALRKFKRKVDNDGVLIEFVKRQHYEKPSVKRKREAAQARSRWLKKQQQLRERDM